MKAYLWLFTFLAFSSAVACQRGTVKPPADEPPPPVIIDDYKNPGGTVVPTNPSDDNTPWGRPTVYQKYLTRSGDPAPPLPVPNNRCETLAEVRDYSGLDGCQMLLETDGGNLLLVETIIGGYNITLGSRIRFGFEYVEDAVTICMHEDAVIRVTCVQEVRESSGIPRPIVCEAYDEVSEWLYDLAIEYAANYITRVPWSGGRYAYFFETAEGQYLYDCQGYLLCRAPRNCLQFIEDFSEGVLIYEN